MRVLVCLYYTCESTQIVRTGLVGLLVAVDFALTSCEQTTDGFGGPSVDTRSDQPQQRLDPMTYTVIVQSGESIAYGDLALLCPTPNATRGA